MASTNDEADIDDSGLSTKNQINALLTEYHWSFSARTNFQFTMPDSETDYEDTRDLLIEDYPDDNHEDVTAMPGFMATAIRQAIGQFNQILNFEITEQSDNNVDTQLRYGLITTSAEDAGANAYAWVPKDDGLFSEQENWKSGDMFYIAEIFGTQDLTTMVGSYQYFVILHETGHALGLKHSHEADHGNPALERSRDSIEFTVMSYRSYIGDNLEDNTMSVSDGDYAQTLMMLDIQALQWMYGADFTTQSSDTTYRWDTAGKYFINGVEQWDTNTGCIFLTIWDGGGNDTYDFSAFTTNQDINLQAGDWSSIGTQLAILGDGQIARANVFNALMFNGNTASLIENAIGGTGNDMIRGNVLNNSLTGGDGRDFLIGDLGHDTLVGGSGADTLRGDDGDDRLTGGGGGDRLNGGSGYDLALYVSPSGETVQISSIGAAGSGTWAVAGIAEASGDSLIGIEGFVFGVGDDRVTLLDSVNQIVLSMDGAGGNDVLTGSVGPQDVETFIGGTGTDTIRPMAGVFFAFAGAQAPLPFSWVEALADNDLLQVDRRSFGANYTWEPTSFAGFSSFRGTDLSTARGFARIDYLGSGFVDRVTGGLGNDTLQGFGGNDVMNSGTGDDILNGGDGDDQLDGGIGNDTLLGGLGIDVLMAGDGDDRLETGGGSGGPGSFGGNGNDTLIGSDDRDVMRAEGDHDILRGFGGDDELYGGTGSDTIFAGAGNDYIESSSGLETGVAAESVDGGLGYDTLMVNRTLTTHAVSFFLNGAVGSDGSKTTAIEDLRYLGGSGNDKIVGAQGNDLINSGDGDDSLNGLSGNDALNGGFGDDTLRGGDGTDRIMGWFGNDTIYGGVGADFLNGHDGDDLLETGGGGGDNFGGNGNDTLIGSDEADVLRGDSGNDILRGVGGNDQLTGGDGNDAIFAGDGNDNIDPGLGVEYVGGGLGFDTLTVSRHVTTLGVSFFLNGAVGSDGTRTEGIEDLFYFGGSGNDRVVGGDARDRIDGNDGNDSLEGRLGNDQLTGGNGNDTLLGGLGTDFLLGGEGDDRLETGGGGGDNFGGNGNDALIGSDEVDVLRGEGGNDVLRGFGGNDQLTGGDGNDRIFAGDGNDVIDPGLGVEYVGGGLGFDTLTVSRHFTTLGVSFFLNGAVGSDGTRTEGIEDLLYFGGSGNDRVVGGDARDLINGSDGNDSLEGRLGNDQLTGGNGNDTLLGGLGTDFLLGGEGDDRLETGGGGGDNFGGNGNDALIGSDEADVLRGEGGNDILRGFGGNDQLTGGDGDDSLFGGAGGDNMDGGLGNDVFIFTVGAGSDVVMGFDSDDAAGQDLMDVRAFNYANFAAMLADGVTIATSGVSALIAFGTDRPIVLLSGVAAATINGTDFLF